MKLYANQVTEWPAFGRELLPPGLANLPTMVAEPWINLGPGSSRGLLEGPIFDKEGNLLVCYRVRPITKIMKITPDKQATEFFVTPEGEDPVGLAVHADGRVFGATLCKGYGKIYIITPDAKLERAFIPEYDGEQLKPDDLVFDAVGNLYFTDLRGEYENPNGGVYRLDAEGDYTKITKLVGNISGANGISFSPDCDVLWVGESVRNRVLRISMTKEGFVKPGGFSIQAVYTNIGNAVVDSNKVDSAGNLYQAMMWGGRAVVLNHYGIPIANIVVPDRDQGKYMNSPNLVIKPGTDEGYLIGTGPEGAWIHKFKAIAPAQKLFSHSEA